MLNADIKLLLLLKQWLLFLLLISIIHQPAGTNHFSQWLCSATETGYIFDCLQPGSIDGWLLWLR